MSANHTDALLIFAKWPEPGKVKTRLSPPLTPEEAAELYRCMMLDTFDSTGNIDSVTRTIFFDGDSERGAVFGEMSPDAKVFIQIGNDLGERLANAFNTAFSAGCRSAVVIGTDSPHIPAERITEAFSMLNEGNADVVFGPSEDGGYYLLGLKAMRVELFLDIPWSTGKVIHTSINRCESEGLKVSLLGSGFDLDTIEDLKRLAALQDNGLAGRTRRLVKSLGY